MRDSTIFLSLYGRFRKHTDFVEHTFDEDAYSLFVSRAATFGWQSVHTAESALGPWAMNDAYSDWRDCADVANVAWFQVMVNTPPGPRAPLPLVPLLRCATDTVGRIGTIDLTGVQTYVPIHLAGTSLFFVDSMRNWFTDVPHDRRTFATLLLDSGDASDTKKAADRIEESLRSYLLGPTATLVARRMKNLGTMQRPSPTEPNWMGNKHSLLSFDLIMCEWTSDAIGYVLAAGIEACRSAGVNVSTLIDLSRDPDSEADVTTGR